MIIEFQADTILDALRILVQIEISSQLPQLVIIFEYCNQLSITIAIPCCEKI